jgi:hypothetical protein
MIENIDLDEPIVQEALRSMISKISWSKLEQLIKSRKPVRREFTKGGFEFDPHKNKDRAVKIVYQNFKDKFHILFSDWLEDKDEYSDFFNSYFKTEEYEEWSRDNVSDTTSFPLPGKFFDKFIKISGKQESLYFLYFSPIIFTEKQVERLKQLSHVSDVEKAEIILNLRQRINGLEEEKNVLEQEIKKIKKKSEKNERSWQDEKKELNKKAGKEINELKKKEKEYESRLETLSEKKTADEKEIETIDNKLKEIEDITKTQADEINRLKEIEEKLFIKELELENIQTKGLADYIEMKKEEVNKALEEFNGKLVLKQEEYDRILIQIEKEKQIEKSLEEIKRQKRKELSEYIKNGERWKLALFPGHTGNTEASHLPGKTFEKNDEDKEVLKEYFQFESLLNNSGFSKDEIISIKQNINLLSRSPICWLNDADELVPVEKFFESIGHKCGRFILNTDISWLTPKSLWETPGLLSGCEKPAALSEVFDFAKENRDIIFQVEILGADRAPIEGYFGIIIKSFEKDRRIVLEDSIVEIPFNVFFFLQLDNDEYCANSSEWLKKSLNSIEFPSIKKIPKKIFVPFDVFFRRFNT